MIAVTNTFVQMSKRLFIKQSMVVVSIYLHDVEIAQKEGYWLFKYFDCVFEIFLL